MSISIGAIVGIVFVVFIISFGSGVLLSAVIFKKKIKQKPLISEAQVRELYRCTGKKLSETQLLRIMNHIKNYG